MCEYFIFESILSFFYNWSNTYEKIQEKSDTVWKNQRYQVILEYRSIFSPPINWINFIYEFVTRGGSCTNGSSVENSDSDCKFLWLTILNSFLILFFFYWKADILIDYEQKSAQELLKHLSDAAENLKNQNELLKR